MKSKPLNSQNSMSNHQVLACRVHFHSIRVTCLTGVECTTVLPVYIEYIVSCYILL